VRRLQVGLRRVGCVALLAMLAGAAGAQPSRAGGKPCIQPRVTSIYSAAVVRALRARKDVWGNRVLRAPGGPTYERVERLLKPLLLAGAPGRSKNRLLTSSGVYYLPFGWPGGGFGAGSVALHVADGSEIVSERVGGPRLTVTVGSGRLTRYGSCLARLSTPRLYGGYLPILDTEYVDSAGVRYDQESFATRIRGTRSLLSFVRLTADSRRSRTGSAQVRFTLSGPRLWLVGDRLVRGDDTHLFLGEGGSFDGWSVTYPVEGRARQTFYVAWLVHPSSSKPLRLDAEAYDRAREALIDFWDSRLGDGATMFVVPERRVLDAERSLLIQNSELAWRYSSGNTYQQFSVPEAIDTAQVMGEYGFGDVEQAILRTSFWRKFRYANWKRGEVLLGSARYYRLFRDRRYLAAATPTLSRYVAALGRDFALSGRGILGRERYSADIAAPVYGLHAQAVVWDGLRSIARAWALTGHPELAARSRKLAAKLGAGLRAAVRRSESRLPDGSLFVPVRLFDGEQPYRDLTATKAGSYWNLVAPYAFATGLLKPRSPQALAVLRYMLQHGSRFLGLVRAGAYALYRKPHFPTSGSDQVYGVNVARFLTDNDQPDQLVLSLYGQLAAGMTPGTFVTGEGATIAPLRGEYFRKMFLPPNSGGNSAFLETLRLMLVHETRDGRGEPRGLELAYATPRPWLRAGQRIDINGAPTSFGPVTLSIEAMERSASVSLQVPNSPSLRTLRLRLRLPAGKRITSVLTDGDRFRRFDPATGTIDLSGLRGDLSLVVRYSKPALKG
jgi:hypothetical protein